MPTNYYTSGIQDLTMTWDIPKGNLTECLDAYAGTSGIAEKFSYDNLQRLTSSQLVMGGSTPPLLTASIDPVGDYVSKHDAGSEFTYNGQFQAHLVKNDNSEIPLVQQQVSYTTFNEPNAIDEGSHHIEFTYGPEKTRLQTRFFQNGSTEESELRHYVPEMGYEVVKKNGLTHHMIYVPLFGNTMAILRQEVDPGTGGLGEPGGDGGSITNSVHYVYKDHLGSWLHITDDGGTIEAQQNFDPWGRRRDPINWTYTTTGPTQDWLIRGYTTHEHLDDVGIIHMNGRLYDPIIGRMFSPDNFVQSPFNTQSYNRYAYAFNNPLKYRDPDGEVVLAAVIAGAVIGAYMGGVMANSGDYSPWATKGKDVSWNFRSEKTWGYMVGGAIVGGLSGWIGGTLATSGIPMANTAGIAGSSLMNSLGTYTYTSGKTDISISFGVASYNFSKNELGYFGKRGNSALENVGYGLGALANISDLGKAGDMLLNVEKKDLVNHAAIKDPNGNPVISYGPGDSPKYDFFLSDKSGRLAYGKHYGKMFGGLRGSNSYPIHGSDLPIKGVNTTLIKGYGKMLSYLSDKGAVPYSFLYSSCTTHAGLALWISGVPNLFVHPYALQASVWLWNQGVTPAIIQNSYHLSISK